ncbi:Concanavalin A-like lectin/glucanases superfamily protein [Candidatus Anstonella stagnisolia]|nr:Concanavalin A-like lectin/glucanases superfamily protein [Candidatus Anstonella stagnisolia]
MKAQGATEYLVIVGVVLMIALVCVALLVWPIETTNDVKQSQSDIKCGITKNAVPDIMQGLVGYWKFDEGSGTVTYDRKNSTSGTLVNGTAWAIGKSNTAADFDGIDDYINAGTNSITGTSPFTLSTWLKGRSNTNYALAVMVGNGAGSQSAWLGAYSPGTTIGGGIYGTNINSGITSEDEWHCATLTFSGGTGGTISLYVDGILKGTKTITPNLRTTSITFGNANVAPNYWYNGTVDEVLIYNRVLSADEIKFLSQYPGCP